MKLRVLSYNVHQLFNFTRTHYFLSELKRMLSDLDLDFVFLQEIRGMHPERFSGRFGNDPLEHLADELWDYFIYGKNAIYSSGNHGNAILSKYPFVEWKNFDISNSRFQKRSLLLGILNVNRVGKLRLCCTHLDLTQRGRFLQLHRIEEILGENGNRHPTLFCGDFNDWNGKITKKLVLNGFKSVPPFSTFPSFYPLLSLDRILYDRIEFENARVLEGKSWRRLSDHLPIYAEFRIEEEKHENREF